MAQKSDVDIKLLWELVQQGKNAQEIMKELQISEVTILKDAVQNLVDENGENVQIPDLIGEGSLHESYTDTGARVPPGMPKGK